jgi:competence ComEA-like helix-hairpin-helix protein
MDRKQILKEYFTFSKKDRIGIYFILALILIIYFLPTFFNSSHPPILPADTAIAKIIDTIQQQKVSSNNTRETFPYNHEPTYEKGFIKGELFVFDPNTLSAEGWEKLGLRDRTIKTIMNYRNKGGKFYKPEDLQRIWGLPDGFYEHVANHINIASTSNNYHQPTYASNGYEKKEKRIEIIDINNADTAAYIALPGIGSKLASRIVNFRDKLGGFHSIEQIKETYGLPDSTFQTIKQYLKLNTAGIKKFQLNTATKEELKAHPYFRWQLANAIVEYRTQHGPFKSAEDVKKILIIDENTFNKIAPYIEL